MNETIKQATERWNKDEFRVGETMEIFEVGEPGHGHKFLFMAPGYFNGTISQSGLFECQCGRKVMFRS